MSLLKNIKLHEGFRNRVYKCSEGYDTIGYGFAIKDLEMDEDIAELILLRKIEKLQHRIASVFGWWYNSPKTIKDSVTNMCYQMGISGFSKFKKTIYYLETEQYDEAATECLNSFWAKQTPVRAREISEAIRSLATD